MLLNWLSAWARPLIADKTSLSCLKTGVKALIDRHYSSLASGLIFGVHYTLRDGLANHARLQYELTTLRNQAAKEKQLNRRVELNMTIKRLEVELAAILPSLYR